MPLFVITHHAGPTWDHDVPFHEQPTAGTHIEFMHRLDADGVMRAGGPFPDGGTDPVGMVVVEAEDLAAAQAMADMDESLRNGLLTAQVRPWTPRMGSWLEG